MVTGDAGALYRRSVCPRLAILGYERLGAFNEVNTYKLKRVPTFSFTIYGCLSVLDHCRIHFEDDAFDEARLATIALLRTTD